VILFWKKGIAATKATDFSKSLAIGAVFACPKGVFGASFR
jgi:hypothetical protein